MIPARGGSKGIPLKNLRKVGGVPIVELASQVASAVEFIDRIVVSTDNEEIAKAAMDGIDDMQDAFWKASLEKNKQSDHIYMELIVE